MYINPSTVSDFNSQPHKEADGSEKIIRFVGFISTHSLTRRLTINRQVVSCIVLISTHSLTRRLTAILFNKNCFLHFIFITIYQSPPHSLLLSPLFAPCFHIFSKNFRCESPGDWVGAWGSHYRIRVSVTSKPCFAPMCSTLFLYLSPR